MHPVKRRAKREQAAQAREREAQRLLDSLSLLVPFEFWLHLRAYINIKFQSKKYIVVTTPTN